MLFEAYSSYLSPILHTPIPIFSTVSENDTECENDSQHSYPNSVFIGSTGGQHSAGALQEVNEYTEHLNP